MYACHFSPCSRTVLASSGFDLHLLGAPSGSLKNTFKGRFNPVNSSVFFLIGRGMICQVAGAGGSIHVRLAKLPKQVGQPVSPATRPMTRVNPGQSPISSLIQRRTQVPVRVWKFFYRPWSLPKGRFFIISSGKWLLFRLHTKRRIITGFFSGFYSGVRMFGMGFISVL